MIFHALEDAVFLRRNNRFAAQVLWRGREVTAHVPNSGRLAELLTPGAAVRVQPAPEGRRTVCSLVMAHNLDCWVVINAHYAEAVAYDAICAGLVPGLEDVRALRREVYQGDSRFDMYCTVDDVPQFIEVKCATLQREGVAMFPDAPTERGRKHLRGLAELAAGGVGCHVLFVLQHPLARSFAPNVATDPQFAVLLDAAIAAGVWVHGLVCEVGPDSIEAVSAFPIGLSGADTMTPRNKRAIKP